MHRGLENIAMEQTAEQTEKKSEVLTATTVESHINDSPDMMFELTQQFIAKKSLNDRAKLRLQMKAILDFISVNTEYPGAEKKETPKDDYAPRRYEGGRLVDAPDHRQNENILGGGV